MTGVGDNSINSGHLKAFIERIERLEEEKRALAEDIKEVFAEAKGTGRARRHAYTSPVRREPGKHHATMTKMG